MTRSTTALALAALLGCWLSSSAIADPLFGVREALRAGDSGAAASLLDPLLLANPGDPDAQLLAAEIKWQNGDSAAALSSLQALAELYPVRPEPLNNQAVILAAVGRTAEARELLEKAMSLQPGFRETYRNLGDLYSQLAAEAYQQATGIAPSKSALGSLRLSRVIGFSAACETPDTP